MMKSLKMIAAILIFCLALSSLSVLAGADESAVFTSPEEITMEKIREMLIPENMIACKGGVEMQFVSHDAAADTDDILKLVYVKTGDFVAVEQTESYGVQYNISIYFTTDPEDYKIYALINGTPQSMEKDISKLEIMMDIPVLEYDVENTTIASREEADGMYEVCLEYMAKEEVRRDLLVIDPVTGMIQAIYEQLGENREDAAFTDTFTYGDDLTADDSPKTSQPVISMEDAFEFSTTDLQGNEFSEQDLKGSKLVMINFWEPWCGPCVGEMPELEELYQKYKDEGLIIVGVFATPNSDEDAMAVIEQTGVTYPILHSTAVFEPLMSNYVPTTVFLDGDGKLVGDTQIGAKSLADWELLVKGLME